MAAEILSIFIVLNAVSTSKNGLWWHITSGIFKMAAVPFGAVAMLFVMVAEMFKTLELLLTVGTIPEHQQFALLFQVTNKFLSAA
jgi:hypothetical protein